MKTEPLRIEVQVKEAMRLLGFSQAALAERLGWTQPTLCRRLRDLKVSHLLDIAQVLKVAPARFFEKKRRKERLDG